MWLFAGNSFSPENFSSSEWRPKGGGCYYYYVTFLHIVYFGQNCNTTPTIWFFWIFLDCFTETQNSLDRSKLSPKDCRLWNVSSVFLDILCQFFWWVFVPCFTSGSRLRWKRFWAKKRSHAVWSNNCWKSKGHSRGFRECQQLLWMENSGIRQKRRTIVVNIARIVNAVQVTLLLSVTNPQCHY